MKSPTPGGLHTTWQGIPSRTRRHTISSSSRSVRSQSQPASDARRAAAALWLLAATPDARTGRRGGGCDNSALTPDGQTRRQAVPPRGRCPPGPGYGRSAPSARHVRHGIAGKRRCRRNARPAAFSAGVEHSVGLRSARSIDRGRHPGRPRAGSTGAAPQASRLQSRFVEDVHGA